MLTGRHSRDTQTETETDREGCRQAGVAETHTDRATDTAIERNADRQA
eukprot:COSAG02_NODE_72639_length_183_cov_17.440476_1_plen_48_part_00